VESLAHFDRNTHVVGVQVEAAVDEQLEASSFFALNLAAEAGLA
jgi:hypothetical protein